MKQQFVTSELSLEAQIQSHFITMNYEKIHKVKGWYKYQKPNTVRENRFLADVSIALEIITEGQRLKKVLIVMNGRKKFTSLHLVMVLILQQCMKPLYGMPIELLQVFGL